MEEEKEQRSPTVIVPAALLQPLAAEGLDLVRPLGAVVAPAVCGAVRQVGRRGNRGGAGGGKGGGAGGVGVRCGQWEQRVLLGAGHGDGRGGAGGGGGGVAVAFLSLQLQLGFEVYKTKTQW